MDKKIKILSVIILLFIAAGIAMFSTAGGGGPERYDFTFIAPILFGGLLVSGIIMIFLLISHNK
jgi:hypothetical protein